METVQQISPTAYLRVHRVEPGGGRSGVDAHTMSSICRSRITPWEVSSINAYRHGKAREARIYVWYLTITSCC